MSQVRDMRQPDGLGAVEKQIPFEDDEWFCGE
jgi:hypothetical protein